jgi:hypothetical protein
MHSPLCYTFVFGAVERVCLCQESVYLTCEHILGATLGAKHVYRCQFVSAGLTHMARVRGASCEESLANWEKTHHMHFYWFWSF